MMSNENNKKILRQRCDACDFQKLKQLESNPVVRKLQDKIEQLSFRLTECKNENQMLKRNLQLAKKMVCQEVGGKDVDFQALLKHGTETGWKGRQEDILILKNQVKKLKEYLRELEGNEPPDQEVQPEELVKSKSQKDRGKLWRLELERRLAKEDAQKDISPLAQECVDLRKNLATEKNRFKELSEEIKILRNELRSQVEKNKEDVGIVNSFKTLENQLQETLAERAEIRQDMDSARTRNRRLVEELSLLKNELQALQKKTKDNCAAIESLTCSRKNIEEAIDTEKVIVKQNTERYKEELKTIEENYAADGEILDHLQCIIYDRNDLVDEINRDVDVCFKKINTKKNNKDYVKKNPTTEESRTVQSTALENKILEEAKEPVQNNASEEQNELKTANDLQKLRLECARFKALCDASKMEGDRLSYLIANQDQKMNEIAVQVVETGRLIMQKNAEKKEMFEKINRLQRSLSTKRKRGTFQVQSVNRQDELRIQCDAQKEENDYLRNFLRCAVCSKGKDLQEMKSIINECRHHFETFLKEIKASGDPNLEN